MHIFLSVATDDNGVNVDDLEKRIEEHKKHSNYEMTDKHPFWAVVYLVPTYNNPQSSCLHPGKKFCSKLKSNIVASRKN